MLQVRFKAPRLFLQHQNLNQFAPPSRVHPVITKELKKMASSESSSNPLVTTRAPDATLSVQLHPLVLLTISDYITRHTLRSQDGPVLGAIIGQSNGRISTLEHAFECKVVEKDSEVVLDEEWFQQRLEQYKDVHKAPALDLVGMFMMGPVNGPQKVHLPVIRQVQYLTSTEGILLLVFHGSMVDQLQGGKLPISLYETVNEQMGDEWEIKFRELSFEVETGEAEMIGVDFVAKGGGNATAVTKTDASAITELGKKEKGKGKERAKEKEGEVLGDAAIALSPEDEELIASLTAKANAVKMLNQRINLIRQYLETLPESYLQNAASAALPPTTTNHTLLRSIQALLSRIPLLAPPNSVQNPPEQNSTPISTLQNAGMKAQQDVHLTTLLAALTNSISVAQSLGSKFHILQREKQNKERNVGFGTRGGRGAGGFTEEYVDSGGL